MSAPALPSAEAPPLKTLDVLGRRMTYAQIGPAGGGGRTLLFQHGNPTSSYLWRNVMRPLADLGRCLAVDLIGMGGSDKLPEAGPMTYSLAEHARHLDAAWAQLAPEGPVTLVLHDWGGFLGFDWARRHPERVEALVYMETIVGPVPTWADFSQAAAPVFQGLRSDAGEAMVLDKNVFVEKILPGSVLRGLTEAEMAVYRAPFATPGEDRRPTLDFPRQIPIEGRPPEIAEAAAAYAAFLAASPIPKLFINAEPGAILTGKVRERCRAWPNQTEATVRGSHFIQEDSPAEIAEAIRAFLTQTQG
ncbi:MAG: haloalkane dehalogenase [Pseudomonadota bacterium]